VLEVLKNLMEMKVRKVKSTLKRFDSKNGMLSPIIWVSAYPPDRGRLSEYAEALLHELVPLFPSKITVLSDCKPIKQMSSIEVKSVWRPNKLSSILRLWFEIIKSKSKVVHFNVHLAVFGRSRIINFFGLLSVAIAHFSRKRVVVTLHNIPEGIKLNVVGIKDSIVNRIGLMTATKIILFSADVVVVLLKYYVKLLKERYKVDNVVWIPHGAWFTEVSPTWHWSKGRIRVLFLGYLSSYKALKMLSDVVKEINGELLISGCPHPNFAKEGKEILDSVLNEIHVKYLGYVEDSRLPDLISNVDVVVLPYITSTGTSGVVHLLSGLGVPFITFNTREFRELLLDGAGIFLAEMSKDALKDAIVKVTSNRKLAETLSKRSRHFAVNRRWHNVAKMYLNIYATFFKNITTKG
jgi:glycosyltransferase involved in cell wall biosynthesis